SPASAPGSRPTASMPVRPLPDPSPLNSSLRTPPQWPGGDSPPRGAVGPQPLFNLGVPTRARATPPLGEVSRQRRGGGGCERPRRHHSLDILPGPRLPSRPGVPVPPSRLAATAPQGGRLVRALAMLPQCDRGAKPTPPPGEVPAPAGGGGCRRP